MFPVPEPTQQDEMMSTFISNFVHFTIDVQDFFR